MFLLKLYDRNGTELQIFERDNWTCKTCRDTKHALHVHHTRYTSRNPWEEPEENLLTLCEHCHLIHEIQKGIPVLSVTKFLVSQESHFFIVYGQGTVTFYRGVFPAIEGVILQNEFFTEFLANIKKYYGELIK